LYPLAADLSLRQHFTNQFVAKHETYSLSVNWKIDITLYVGLTLYFVF